MPTNDRLPPPKPIWRDQRAEFVGQRAGVVAFSAGGLSEVAIAAHVGNEDGKPALAKAGITLCQA